MKWNSHWGSRQSDSGISRSIKFSKGSITLSHLLITAFGVVALSLLVFFSKKPEVIVLAPVVPVTTVFPSDVDTVPPGETYSDGEGNTFVKGRLTPELKKIHDEALAAAETEVEFDDEIKAVAFSEDSAELDAMIVQMDEQARQIYSRLGEAVPTSDALLKEIDQTIDVDGMPELSAFDTEVDQFFPTPQSAESNHEDLRLKSEGTSNN